MESRHPGPEDGVDAHGVENPVHPGHTHPIIGVEKIEAKKETRPPSVLQEGHVDRTVAGPSKMDLPATEQSWPEVTTDGRRGSRRATTILVSSL